MKFEKLLYSKCPKCKEHGISLLKTGRYNQPTLVCKKCGAKFKGNGFLAGVFIILTELPFIVLLLIMNRYFKIYFNNIELIIALIFPVLIAQYFLPIENIDEEINHEKNQGE